MSEWTKRFGDLVEGNELDREQVHYLSTLRRCNQEQITTNNNCLYGMSRLPLLVRELLLDEASWLRKGRVDEREDR